MTTLDDIPAELIYNILELDNALISPLTRAHKPTAELIYGNNGRNFELLIKNSSKFVEEYDNDFQALGEGYVVLNGIRDGLWKLYRNDILYMEIKYNLGVLLGERIRYEYFPDNILRKMTNYYFETKDGLEYVYDNNGNLTYKLNYDNGGLHGKILVYDNNFVSSFTYFNDVLSGPAEFLFGEYILSGEFYKGQYDGIWTSEYENEESLIEKSQAFFYKGRIVKIDKDNSVEPSSLTRVDKDGSVEPSSLTRVNSANHSIFPVEGFYNTYILQTYQDPMFDLIDRAILNNKDTYEESIKISDNANIYYVDFLDSEKRLDVIVDTLTPLSIYVKKNTTEINFLRARNNITINLYVNNKIKQIKQEGILDLTLDENGNLMNLDAPNFEVRYKEKSTTYIRRDTKLVFSIRDGIQNLNSIMLEGNVIYSIDVSEYVYINIFLSNTKDISCAISSRSIDLYIKDDRTKANLTFDNNFTIQSYEISKKHGYISKCKYSNGIISMFTKSEVTKFTSISYEYENGILISKDETSKGKTFYIDGIYPNF